MSSDPSSALPPTKHPRGICSHHFKTLHALTPSSLLESLLAMSPSDKNSTIPCPIPPTSKALLPPENPPPSPCFPQARHTAETQTGEKGRRRTVHCAKNKPGMRTLWEGRGRHLWPLSGTQAGTHTHTHTPILSLTRRMHHMLQRQVHGRVRSSRGGLLYPEDTV